MERSTSGEIFLSRITSGSKKDPDEKLVTVECRHVKSSPPELVRGLKVGAGGDESLGPGHSAVYGGHVEGGPPVISSQVDSGALSEEELQTLL